MMRFRATVILLALLLLPALPAAAQEIHWRPPTTRMPLMPTAAELAGDWLGPRADWFAGVEEISGVAPARMRPAGEPRPGSDRVQIARFVSGRAGIPAMVWMDRNGDDRADLIEILRGGGVIVQLIDADHDGVANVLRVYDASGKLLRESRP